jgi:hypothetical protein
VIDVRGHAFVEIRWRECCHYGQHVGELKTQLIRTGSRRVRGTHLASFNQGFDYRQLAVRGPFLHALILTYLPKYSK